MKTKEVVPPGDYTAKVTQMKFLADGSVTVKLQLVEEGPPTIKKYFLLYLDERQIMKGVRTSEKRANVELEFSVATGDLVAIRKLK